MGRKLRAINSPSAYLTCLYIGQYNSCESTTVSIKCCVPPPNCHRKSCSTLLSVDVEKVCITALIRYKEIYLSFLLYLFLCPRWYFYSYDQYLYLGLYFRSSLECFMYILVKGQRKKESCIWYVNRWKMRWVTLIETIQNNMRYDTSFCGMLTQKIKNFTCIINEMSRFLGL